MSFLLRRRMDTAANWASADPVIPNKQLIFVQNAGGTGIPLLKFGNGTDTFSNLPYITKRNNLNASVNPTVSDNATTFYSIGSMWVNVTAKTMFVLTSFSGSDAVWQPIGELITELQQVQDVPTYPNDGYEYVLTELDGVLSWELPSGGGGGAVDSVNGQTGAVVLDEEDIVGTATYNAAMTGTEDLDLSTFVSHYGILTGNTTITVSNTPSSGESFARSLKITSTATETLTLPVSWEVVGEYLADGTTNDLQIEFSNFPTEGLVVWCYINQPS